MGWLQLGIAALGFFTVFSIKLETQEFEKAILQSLSLRHSLLIEPHDAIYQHCSERNATPPFSPCKVPTIEIRRNGTWKNACIAHEKLTFRAPRYYRITSKCQSKVLGYKVKYGELSLLIKR
jgi:hypothetical protein